MRAEKCRESSSLKTESRTTDFYHIVSSIQRNTRRRVTSCLVVEQHALKHDSRSFLVFRGNRKPSVVPSTDYRRALVFVSFLSFVSYVKILIKLIYFRPERLKSLGTHILYVFVSCPKATSPTKQERIGASRIDNYFNNISRSLVECLHRSRYIVHNGKLATWSSFARNNFVSRFRSVSISNTRCRAIQWFFSFIFPFVERTQSSALEATRRNRFRYRRSTNTRCTLGDKFSCDTHPWYNARYSRGFPLSN